MLKKFKREIGKLIDDIQDIADECSIEEGETENAETLWSVQTSLNKAHTTLDNEIRN